MAVKVLRAEGLSKPAPAVFMTNVGTEPGPNLGWR